VTAEVSGRQPAEAAEGCLDPLGLQNRIDKVGRELRGAHMREQRRGSGTRSRSNCKPERLGYGDRDAARSIASTSSSSVPMPGERDERIPSVRNQPHCARAVGACRSSPAARQRFSRAVRTSGMMRHSAAMVEHGGRDEPIHAQRSAAIGQEGSVLEQNDKNLSQRDWHAMKWGCVQGPEPTIAKTGRISLSGHCGTCSARASRADRRLRKSIRKSPATRERIALREG